MDEKRSKVRGGDIADATEATIAANTNAGVNLIRKNKLSNARIGARKRTTQPPPCKGELAQSSHTTTTLARTRNTAITRRFRESTFRAASRPVINFSICSNPNPVRRTTANRKKTRCRPGSRLLLMNGT